MPLRGLVTAVTVISVGATLSTCARAADDGMADAAPACVSNPLTYESREVACSIRADAHARRYRLRVSFSGGHDDTIVSLAAPTLDGAVQACSADSKTRLVGEDGDVSVDCVFVLPGGAATTRFAAIFKWTHAEYTGYALTRL